EIIDDDPQGEIIDDFCEYKTIDRGIIHYKKISKEDLEEVYKIRTHVMYHGKKHYPAGNIIDGKIALLGTIDDVEDGFKVHGPGDYIKENVPLSDIDEFVEEKKPFDINKL
ncbi:MAG: hypothetical protein PQJ60_02155, partial [Spirochaetales bacterium]|nr:hypothetical protein [Spirochaetales bacterium]